MLIVISPAKNLDYDTPIPTSLSSKPSFLKHSTLLAEQLKEMAPHELSELMGISDKLGVLNFDRYQTWQPPFNKKNARQAVFAFKGDVYVGLDAYQFSEQDCEFAQEHLRILSGLYGLLRPLDLIQPYRLEMGTKLANERGKDLYEFWGDLQTKQLNKQLKSIGSDYLINLASNEYFKSVQPKNIDANIITPVFKDKKNDQYKIISFFAKKARGLMSAYIIKNKITSPIQLKKFNREGYSYNAAMSSKSELVFTRERELGIAADRLGSIKVDYVAKSTGS